MTAADKTAAPIKTPFGSCFIRLDGVLEVVLMKTHNTKEQAEAGWAIVSSLKGDEKIYCLAEVTGIGSGDRETREYVSEQMEKHYKALASVTKSRFAALAVYIFFYLWPPSYPQKLFTKKTDAERWIKNYL